MSNFGIPILSPEEVKTLSEYLCLQHYYLSATDAVQVQPFKYIMHAVHPLQESDRLGNPEIDFPIGMVFGDADFFGTEGADDIIRQNKHFATGKSQIFKFTNCSH